MFPGPALRTLKTLRTLRTMTTGLQTQEIFADNNRHLRFPPNNVMIKVPVLVSHIADVYFSY